MTLQARNRKLFTRLAIIAVGMFGFGYALVPFYYQLCEAWGINTLGQTRSAGGNSQVDTSRRVTIELDSNAHNNVAWRFRPLVSQVSVHPGELTTVEYELVNERGEALTAQAVPSYGPPFAGEYFKKIECFCFTQQTLAAGESRRLPVTFVIDPKLPSGVRSIVLSYTFVELAARRGKS
jgi:cytochrome c oxidase assembly protein subunit 11